MLPTPHEERAHYANHENNPDDPCYRAFLSKLALPLIERLSPELTGLDYGCGPGPALAAMLEDAGHRIALYDPFFFPDEQALDRLYDVITCTEVAEHFHDPFGEFEHFDRLMKPGAWLGLMTCFQTDDDSFANWHYRRDLTHVVFYREATLRHVAASRGWSCHIPTKDIALMRKPERSEDGATKQ
ncbi:MAG: class I SAM-dependent methyltransferase [Geminicoccales bacterium]